MSDLEDDFNPRAHNTLLQAISGLKRNQHIRQITRNEPKIKQDEFELVKGTSVSTKEHVAFDEATQPTTAVAVNDLVQVLRKKKKHIDAGKLLKNVQRTKRVFQKPLEKPAAERIKRQIGYDKVKTKLERWDAVVARNRVAEQQIFPLATETVYINTGDQSKPLQHTVKSDLRREMEAAEERLRQLKRERDGDFENENDLEQRRNELHQLKLTREELKARRKELAYLKIRESQQSAKARMRNKIKSKKYHKLLRRQKLQAQLKEFEQLQKTNPEAALEKLEELEKSRVMERATLRHKNTGAWAKNLQVRAKYDKDVRKDLSEQLKISRELTQKTKAIDDGGDDEAAEEHVEESAMDFDDVADDDVNNPWLTVGGKSKSKDNKTGASAAGLAGSENWRNYWLDRNRNEKLLAAYKAELEAAMNEDEDSEHENETETPQPPKEVKKTKPKATILKTKQAKPKAKPQKLVDGWLVEELDATTTESGKKLPEIDDLFDEVEDRLGAKVQEKLNELKKAAKQLSNKPNKKQKRKSKPDALKNLKDLSFKDTAKRPKIDEELGVEAEEKTARSKNIGANVSVELLAKQEETTAAQSNEEYIDPKKFPNETFKQPKLPAMITAAHDDENGDGVELDMANHNQMTISEAFEDDDIVADFGEEKTKNAELKNTEIDLSMPGWGSWAGAGIDAAAQEQKRAAKRLVLKLAPEDRRRDENKGELYINEESIKQVRPHLVSDLPFPFTSLQDYEASIRAPIGRNFVPETAFRMLTRPAVITRKGTIIEPMDESELTKMPRRPSNTIDFRIKQEQQQAVKGAVSPAAGTAKAFKKKQQLAVK